MSGSPVATYQVLVISGERGDPVDRHLLSCVVAAGLAQTEQPLWDYLGLPPALLRLMVAAYFPNAGITVPRDAKPRPESIEEEDFRLLLLAHRSREVPEEEWLAWILARRAQGCNHLWEDLGLTCRDDLNTLIHRHFPSVFVLNDKNMKWKKFFYRMMCEAEGMRLCKSPNCEQCPDVGLCFESDSLVLRKVG